MRVLSWNIQSGKGCDHHFNIARIEAVIKAFEQPDVICLQEVSRYIQAYNGDDQVAFLQAAFSDYYGLWAPGFSRPIKSFIHKGQTACTNALQWQEFGNLSLVKKDLLIDSRSHILPSPYVDSRPQIPRSLSEVIVRYQGGSLAILNTHLAYHSELESSLQLGYLKQLKAQIMARRQQHLVHAKPALGGAYQTCPTGHQVLLCGDLNIALNSPQYTHLLQDAQWHDCASEWLKASAAVRLPTCGVFDHELWPEGPHTRDYFLSSSGLCPVVRGYQVNTDTAASDHQPLLLTLA